MSNLTLISGDDGLQGIIEFEKLYWIVLKSSGIANKCATSMYQTRLIKKI